MDTLDMISVASASGALGEQDVQDSQNTKLEASIAMQDEVLDTTTRQAADLLNGLENLLADGDILQDREALMDGMQDMRSAGLTVQGLGRMVDVRI